MANPVATAPIIRLISHIWSREASGKASCIAVAVAPTNRKIIQKVNTPIQIWLIASPRVVRGVYFVSLGIDRQPLLELLDFILERFLPFFEYCNSLS